MLLTLFVIGSLLLVLVLDSLKPRGYPPGPAWLPLVGNYLHLRRKKSELGYYHIVWDDLARRYGPVVGLRLGKVRAVVVSGKDAVSEVLTRDDFDGRPDGFFFKMRTFGQRLGVVFTDGSHWQNQRQFALQHLRNFGFGKNGMERHIATEAEELIANFRKQRGPVALHQAFDVCILNSLWTMLAGERFSLDDERLAELLDVVHASFRMLDMSGGLLNQMPFLRFVAPQRSGYSTLVSNLNRLWSFLKETINEHHMSLCQGGPRDLIDAFLIETKKQNQGKESFFSEPQLLSLCLDMFMAGSETTSNTLGFAMVYMLLYPEVQRKIQAELDAVVGRERLPSLLDRAKLCYTEATLMEIQRITSVAPVSVAHRALRDTTLTGYHIPEGTTILVSIWSLHMDKSHWKDPENFRPERFIDESGKLKHDKWLMPFGFGHRRCLGEGLARSSMFLFFSSVLHSFSLTVPEGYPAPSVQGYDGVTLSPKPYHALLTTRT